MSAPSVTRAGITVHRFMGKFFELPRDHVNAYIVELPRSVVIVDATLALSSARELRSRAEALGKPIEAVLLTHGHPDHYAGLKAFEDLPRLSSRGALEFAGREDVAKAPTASYMLGEDWPAKRAFPNVIVRDGESAVFGGVRFTFNDLGPAESDSDGVWTCEYEGVRHAFVGDAVANRAHCFVRDGHTSEWLKVLDRLDRELEDDTRVYVGHGEPVVGRELIPWQRGYIRAYLDAVERLGDPRDAIAEADQQGLIRAMQDYLPGEATLFLFAYELDVSVRELWRGQGKLQLA